MIMVRLSHFKLRKEQKAQAINREQLVRFAEALNSFLQQIANSQSEEEKKLPTTLSRNYVLCRMCDARYKDDEKRRNV